MNSKGTVLITGAARRVGAELVRGFTRAGYHVALNYYTSEGDAKLLAEETGASLFQQDLLAENAATMLIEAVFEKHSDCKVIINNASTFRRCFLEKSSDESLLEDMQINALVPMNLMREFAKRVPSGKIINMLDTSISGYHPSHFGYLVAKKALAEATKMAAREYAPSLAVNGICPGHLLPTEGEVEYDPSKEKLAKPTVEQVVNAALMLAETESYFGQLLTIDGGRQLLA
jgi:pteridine reductase